MMYSVGKTSYINNNIDFIFKILKRPQRSEMQCYRISILKVSECRWSGFGRLRTQTGEIILYSSREDDDH